MRNSNPTMIRNLNTKKSGFPILVFVFILLSSLILGGTIGYALSSNSATSTNSSGTTNGQKTINKSAGIADKKTFPDEAEGVLKNGGFEGEGSFHLERPGGQSQNVYLSSTTVDLTEFVGKKVKVMGKTYDTQKAGWLMDVGYVELK